MSLIRLTYKKGACQEETAMRAHLQVTGVTQGRFFYRFPENI